MKSTIATWRRWWALRTILSYASSIHLWYRSFIIIWQWRIYVSLLSGGTERKWILVSHVSRELFATLINWRWISFLVFQQRSIGISLSIVRTRETSYISCNKISFLWWVAIWSGFTLHLLGANNNIILWLTIFFVFIVFLLLRKSWCMKKSFIANGTR